MDSSTNLSVTLLTALAEAQGSDSVHKSVLT